MKLLEILSHIIVESRVYDYFENFGYKFYVFETAHSSVATGQGALQRVDLSEILDSMSDIKDIIAKNALTIVDKCEGKECALIVRDNRLGFDYQMWLKKRRENKIDLVINTSIRHPKKLFNTRKNRMIIVDYNGEQVMYENFELIKVKNLVIQFGVMIL